MKSFKAKLIKKSGVRVDVYRSSMVYKMTLLQAETEKNEEYFSFDKSRKASYFLLIVLAEHLKKNITIHYTHNDEHCNSNITLVSY